MSYDPFVRGQYPVGVQSGELNDESRARRRVELELWYPAAADHRSRDLEPETQDLYSVFGMHHVRQPAVRDARPEPGTFPLVVFSHGLAGHRRQSTFFCTHLASHGYVVIAPDHGGSTLADLFALAMRMRAGELPEDVQALLQTYVLDRPLDVQLIIDALATRKLVAPCEVDLARIAVTGHSFGGFTALAVAGRDTRVRAVVALAPAGGQGPLSSPAMTGELTLAYEGRVASLLLALERDSLLPLSGVEQLYRRIPSPARMFVLPNADHMHFCDRAESSHEFFRTLPRVGALGQLIGALPPISELVPGEHGYAFANALGLAHLDSAIQGRAEAEHFLAHEAAQAFAARGISVREL